MYAAEHARRAPEQPALLMEATGELLTFGEYEAECNRLANWLRGFRLRRGDHIAMFMENHHRLLEAMGAAERAGLYHTSINSQLSVDEVAYIVNDSQARVVLTTSARMDVAAELPCRCPAVERWIVVDSEDAITPWETWSSLVAECPPTPIEDESPGMAMLYSSGTTGRPKGILRPLPEWPVGTVMANPLHEAFGLRAGAVYLSTAPLYHSAAYFVVSIAIQAGASTVVMGKFDPERALDLVESFAVTHTQMVPTMFNRILKLPAEVRAAADVSSLESVLHGAAPCPPAVKEQMIEWFGPILLEYYGATEAHGLTLCNSREWLTHRGTVGRPVLGDLLILDDHGEVCPAGTTGEVWFRGATNFSYFNDPAQTTVAQMDTEAGCMSTVGDVGFVDDDGFLHLTDRKTHMIISGGVNIYPQETEDLLISHPKVMDAAVIGVPNEDFGEEVKAVIQAAASVDIDAALELELIAYCREQLAHFKCPRSVDFVESLPRSPTGKLYKRLLRDRYWQGRESAIV
jgi:long-chain acyl-CoA synthetase